MSHKQQKFDENTDTSMFFGMLADKTKMKPVTKEVKIEKIEEGVEDSELAMGIGARVSARTFTSSDSKSSVSSVSSNSRRSDSSDSSRSSRSSSSSRSSRSSRDSTSTKSHKDLNNYINRFNTIKDTGTPEPPHHHHHQHSEKLADVPYVSARDKKIHRMKVFFALEDMKEQGIKLTKNYHIDSNLEEMEDELALQSDRQQRKDAINIGKDGILKGVQWIERGNKFFDPIGARLSGWHRQMSTNINNYDSALGKFHDKYKHLITNIEPELQIPLMIAASGLAFHCTQKYVEEHGLQELVKEKPDLLNKIQSTIASVIETNVGGEPEEKVQKKPELTQAELYQRVQQRKQQQNVAEQGNAVDNTINEMMGSQSNYMPPQQQNMAAGMPPLMPGAQMNIPIQKPRRINQLMNNRQNKEVISLNTETSRNVMVETVDSESVADTGLSTSQKRLRGRIKIKK